MPLYLASLIIGILAVLAGCVRRAAIGFGIAISVAAPVFGPQIAGADRAFAQARSEPGDDTSEGGHYTIAVHLSSEGTGREALAIRDFVEHRKRAINAAGGILGRRLKVTFFDDEGDGAKTAANVADMLSDPRLIGGLGIWSSSRGANVVDSIGASGVPFISEMSVETLFADHPRVYSLAHSVRDEVSVLIALAGHAGVESVAYMGLDNDRFTAAYAGYLQSTPDAPRLGTLRWESGDSLDSDAGMDAAIDAALANGPQLVVLALGSRLGARVLERMTARGLDIPVFVSYGNIGSIFDAAPNARDYKGILYEVSSGGVANLNNERIESLTRDLGLTKRTGTGIGRGYSARELGYGARYADLAELMAEAAGGAVASLGAGEGDRQPSRDIADIRQRVAAGLEGLREGHRYWQGRAQYWTFSADRSTSERAMLLWRSPGQGQAVLHPTQFLRIDKEMRRVPVLYLHLDMVRMFEVDTNERRFDAEFYLTLRSHADLRFESIDFTNAYRTNLAAEPIRWREVATYRDDPQGRLGVRRIYHVTGRFAFEPDLAKYPFDEQLVTISFQPADSRSIFILQPPGEALRSKTFNVEDWSLVSHYVGTTDRIITSVRGANLEEHVVPYYNFNYTWVMRREVIDYLVRVIVPLSFILIVAYLSAFIPRREFNATIAIQVTALLSAIALYFALNQPNSDEVTLSDKIFVSAYAIVSLMIALSIFEIDEGISDEEATARAGGSRGPHLTTLRATQIYVVPLLTLAVIGWLIASAATDRSISEGIREIVRLGLLAFSDFMH